MKAALPTPPAQGVVRKGLAPASMLRELVFLSIAVLRPRVAKDLTTKYGINSLGWGGQSFCIRTWTSGAKHECPCSTCICSWSTAILVQRGDLASCCLLRGCSALVPPELGPGVWLPGSPLHRPPPLR